MDYFEAIEDYLEAESIVTAQWLANEIGISSDKASSLLQDYEAQNTGKISKSYVMMGYDNDNHLSCQIVHDQGSHKFDRVLYQKLYSIQKSSSNQVNTLMVHSILRQAEAMLLQDSLVTDRNSFVYNGLGPIRNSSIQIKNFGERVFSEQNLHFKRALSTSGMTLKSIPSMTKPKENVPVTNSVVTQAANAFFNKTATIKPVNAPAVPTSVETLPVPAPKPVENKSGEKRKLEKKYQSSSAMDDSEDEEWDVEIESNKKAKLNNEEPKVMDVVEEKENVSVAKNVPETVESDEGDEGDEEEDEVDENDENKNENKEKKPRKKRSSSSKKKNLHVHGAMDDFMEEAAVEKFKQEQQHQQEQGNQIPVRKMKKVLVEKCTVDDRGYFVTEMVYEEVPDDEAGPSVEEAMKSLEPIKRKETENTNKENKINATGEEKKAAAADKEKGLKVQSSAKTAANKKADPKPSGGQQKSMMSFFAKK